MSSLLREKLQLAEDEDLLNRVRRGMLMPDAHKIALEELRARGHKVESLPKVPPEFLEDTPTDKSDFSWQLTAAHWFLIGFISLIQTVLRLKGIPSRADELFGSFFGGLLGTAGLSLVPLAVIFVVNPSRSKIRIKRTYTIAGWCIVTLMFYPLLRS